MLANLRLFWQKDALVTLFFRLRLRLRLCLWHCSSSLDCQGHVFMQCSEDAQMKSGLSEWVSEWVTMSPIEGIIINFGRYCANVHSSAYWRPSNCFYRLHYQKQITSPSLSQFAASCKSWFPGEMYENWEPRILFTAVFPKSLNSSFTSHGYISV